MDVCHSHNLNRAAGSPARFGIRVILPGGDSFARLLAGTWPRYHWYETSDARDRALADMASEHLYSRRGDRPTLVFEPVERDSAEPTG